MMGSDFSRHYKKKRKLYYDLFHLKLYCFLPVYSSCLKSSAKNLYFFCSWRLAYYLLYPIAAVELIASYVGGLKESCSHEGFENLSSLSADRLCSENQLLNGPLVNSWRNHCEAVGISQTGFWKNTMVSSHRYLFQHCSSWCRSSLMF